MIISISKSSHPIAIENAISPIISGLDSNLGVLLASGYDYPGRYTRWDIGFINPPIQIETKQNLFVITALNDRGKVLLPYLHQLIQNHPDLQIDKNTPDFFTGTVKVDTQFRTEEDRSKKPSIFSLFRAIIAGFYRPEDPYLGLYGAWGYDIAFQFEPVELKIPRPETMRDCTLFIPDELIIIDHHAKKAEKITYDFKVFNQSTEGLPREGATHPFTPSNYSPTRSLQKGDYAELVKKTKPFFKRGDLFEVVPGYSYFEPCNYPPSQIFSYLSKTNPAPYSTIMNLGKEEYLVGASPEMFVRVQNGRIETCPISGTIARGKSAVEDAEQIFKLLSSEKEKSELTMCTDVDRNDKSRICEPGSVRVIGRRQIEMYSRLIHTVDHVEGILKKGYDAIDAFLTHMWAVTVTGAPKLWAMRFIESHENSPRHWYGGAIGYFGFDKNINTGITLRTMRIKNSIAEIRVGATLLYEADPQSEESETEIKAAAILEAVRNPQMALIEKAPSPLTQLKLSKKILILDYEDSFVHTLSNYFQLAGAEVQTIRVGFSITQLESVFQSYKPDLVILSPGPGTPQHFNIDEHIQCLIFHNLPIFGICLGLQALVEYFGGELRILDQPVHGKSSQITLEPVALFKGLPTQISVGRYHSIYADLDTFPHNELKITATTHDGIIMAMQHHTLPISAVQFHPESIMSMEFMAGNQIIENLIKDLTIS